MLDYYRRSPDVREVDGAASVFQALRNHGVKVALDTGFGRRITDAVLARLGWAVPGTIDATVTADEVAAGRPAPDMVLRAMQLTGVNDPSRVVKVGDTPSDLEEGTRAGCGAVIGVTSGSHTAGELRPHPHTALIESVRDLLSILTAALLLLLLFTVAVVIAGGCDRSSGSGGVAKSQILIYTAMEAEQYLDQPVCD